MYPKKDYWMYLRFAERMEPIAANYLSLAKRAKTLEVKARAFERYRLCRREIVDNLHQAALNR